VRPTLLHAVAVVVAILAILLLPGLPGQDAHLQAGWIDVSKGPFPSNPDRSDLSTDCLLSWPEEPQEATAQVRLCTSSSTAETEDSPPPRLRLVDFLPTVDASSAQHVGPPRPCTNPNSSPASEARLLPARAQEPLLITFLAIPPRERAPEPALLSIFQPPRHTGQG
jgi:hypothetical protein